MPLTNSQVNRLGERLAAGSHSDSDLAILEEFFEAFSEPYEMVRDGLTELGFEPSGRLPKTIQSIAAKVGRERTRLSTMQDIAGWRIVVETCPDQDQAVALICNRFVVARPPIDLRSTPHHGYRAIHVVVLALQRPVEIQIRTRWQHTWAILSEKLADQFGQDLKYGGGPATVRGLLGVLSSRGAEAEALELDLQTRERDDPDREALDGRTPID